MNDALHLRRMRIRYRVHEHDAALRRRLDALLHTVLDDSLEPALARAGVPVTGEICIRTVHVPVRLSLDGGDAAAAAAWSIAIVEQIASALGGRGEDVVRYRSRREALVDLALGVAQDRLERVWVWRRLGLWRGKAAPTAGAAADELAATLVREPSSIVAVLAAVARAGSLGRLMPRLARSTWVELARLALVEAGAVGSLAESRPVPAPGAPDSGSSFAASQRARRALTGSALARAATSLSPRPPSDTLAALAALAWLEVEPGEASALPVAAGAQVLTALAHELACAAETAPAEAQPPTGEVCREHEARDTAGEESSPVRHTTRFAGILFLLGVLDDLGFPGEVMRAGPFAARGVRWILHRLALTIVAAERDDPAVLAFAGLCPTAEPPPDGDRPLERVELDALEALANRVIDELRTRLLQPDVPAQELVEFVCCRRGEIESDPGWLEVRLPLDELSVELRKAGLDLDPGWVPWLGCVVRFVYA